MSDFKEYLKQSKQKVKSEAETRRNLLSRAKALGCDKEIQKVFDRYDKLLLRTWDAKEREEIGIMGAAELHKVMDCYRELVVNGKLILPADEEYIRGLEGYKEEESSGKIKKMT